MYPRPTSTGAIGGRGPVRERLIHYGPHRSQQVELCLPGGPGPYPVVVLLHGGIWCRSHDRQVMRPLSLDLAQLGFAVLNADYRRPGEQEAGWPDAALDAVSAARLAAGPPGPGEGTLDGRRTALVGHCGGGQLALWAAAWLSAVYGRRPPREIAVRAVVSLAGITDLGAAARQAPGGVGRRPPAAARLSSPIELLPLGKQTAQLLVHGELDERVPVGQSVRYGRRAAAAGDTVRVVRSPGADHLEVVDPRHPSWGTVIAHLAEHLGHCADGSARA